ncbi:DUF4396 domain-containing protein [Marinococcus halotolerans]|uniref:DUF4396 domain-containing protein n=1 Tax=Marinococcus halotolerans TaxID=301092 RepID=UPI0003B6083A|nr:DUF4396 domain-containing protein [Marinococcus halotolerans]
MSVLAVISTVSLIVSALCTVWVTWDVKKHPQPMVIMNVVWPVTVIYSGPVGLIFYYYIGRRAHQEKPMWQSTLASTSHCGAGCALGDIIGIPIVVALGWTIAGTRLFADYIVEFTLAYLLGIFFQLFAILPMNEKMTKREGLKKAIKADTLALVFYEIGMFGWMALVHFVFFTHAPSPSGPTFWFMMQIALMIGFLTSYPINWWLVKRGIKHAM